MSWRKTFTLREPLNYTHLLDYLARHWKRWADAGTPMSVTLSETKRSLAQNSLMWVLLGQWADQKEWVVNGFPAKLTAEEWKEILTAAFFRETVRLAQGLDGGTVMLGAKTSVFTDRQMTAFLEFIQAAATQHGVTLYAQEDGA